MAENGNLVISLDFELLWGVFDHENIESFGERILGAKKVVPKLLELFKKYDIHATWGTVGMLFAEDKEEILAFAPHNKPNYENEKLSPYKHLDDIESVDDYHYANELIELIKNQNHQEIGSHTFSHYYCKEKGQTVETFEDDILTAQRIAKEKQNIKLESLILPRNQFNKEYITVMLNSGFKAVRGNSSHYAYNNSTMLARAIRLLDSYFNICGYKCYDIAECKQDGIINVRASRFFRQYSKKLKLFESIKLNCIKKQMKYAAKNNKVFHLWWHPHNLGKNTEINLEQIETLLRFYKELETKYNFKSKNMREMTKEIYS